MNYNSWVFWLLFAALMIPYWRLSHRRQNTLLLVASYLFYSFWDYRFLFLILISTVIDYIGGLGVAGIRPARATLRQLGAGLCVAALLLCANVNYGLAAAGLLHGDSHALARALPHTLRDFAVPIGTLLACTAYLSLVPYLYAAPEEKRRKWFLTISMVANLTILGFFKYFDFFARSLQHLGAFVGMSFSFPVLNLILPAGISFYTFQAMSYTIDIYRGDAEPTQSFRDFALFVCFFPHLVAGPIMRAHTLLPQVTAPRRWRPGALEEGFYLVVVGLFKKIVIADNLAPIVGNVFARAAQGHGAALHGMDVLVGLYAFAFQIYGDFSGYSAIARGISKWLGFELVVNFRMPYVAVSPSDFWARWHISLSTWLRDYLYIPLGGNRRGTGRTYRNLMITMLLGGLWHGANWTFVAWGLFHGLILCLYRPFPALDRPRGGTPGASLQRWIQILVMFHLTCLGWLLFRAPDLGAVQSMLGAMLSAPHVTQFAVSVAVLLCFYALPLFLLELWTDGEGQLYRFFKAPWVARGMVYSYVILMLVVFHAEKAYGFIYFQF